MTKPLVFLAIAILWSGCVNGFTKLYQDRTANFPPAVVNARLQPYSGNTQVFSSNDLVRDGADLFRRGYVLIGESAFEGGGDVTKGQLMEQARLVGADIVLYSSRFDRTDQAYVPVMQYHPGQTSTTYSSGTVNTAYGSGQYNGYSTTTSPGTFSTTEVPVAVRRFDYDAVFWRQGKPPVFGIDAVNLPDEMRSALKRNTGILVTNVVNDSPAFRANIVPGDIIIMVDDIAINSTHDGNVQQYAFAGKECVLTILRDGKEIKIPVKLNPMP